MNWLDFAYGGLLLLIPILLAISTFQELEKNNRLGNIPVLFLYGAVIIWWAASFFLWGSAGNRTAACWSGIIICAVARLLHYVVNRKNATGDLGRNDADIEAIKRLISILMALFFILIISCVAIMIIIRFLPS